VFFVSFLASAGLRHKPGKPGLRAQEFRGAQDFNKQNNFWELQLAYFIMYSRIHYKMINLLILCILK
jgi:hypothetical protein